MSIVAFKRKSVINYGSNRSGKPPGGYWLPQGPFGAAKQVLNDAIHNYGAVGFSLNGGHRNIGGIGKDMKMSKSGTPYRGQYPIGWGGTKGQYPSAIQVGEYSGSISNAGSLAPPVQPVLNASVVDTLGTQYMYVKPSTLSNWGMLRKKYKWAYYGQYPNYWVQPNYSGNQTGSASQWLYIQNKAAANVCSLKVNDTALYEDYYKSCGPTLCSGGRSTAKFTYNQMVANAPYTKTLYQPVSYAQYNLFLTRGCNNPQGKDKPFPYAVSTGSSLSVAGTSVKNVGTGCNTQPTYLTPPEWYTQTKGQLD